LNGMGTCRCARAARAHCVAAVSAAAPTGIPVLSADDVVARACGWKSDRLGLGVSVAAVMHIPWRRTRDGATAGGALYVGCSPAEWRARLRLRRLGDCRARCGARGCSLHVLTCTRGYLYSTIICDDYREGEALFCILLFGYRAVGGWLCAAACHRHPTFVPSCLVYHSAYDCMCVSGVVGLARRHGVWNHGAVRC